MPRNRAHIDRDGKRAEILDAASALFSERGYDRTSVAAIASRAQITKNTVYWYFDDKDALLVAVISRAVRRARERWEAAPADDLADRLVGMTGVFDDLSSLTTALHARLDASPATRAWHDRFHAASEEWLATELEAHVAAQGRSPLPAEVITSIVRLWTYAIEGMVTHGLPPDDRRALCRTLVAQANAATPPKPERSAEDPRDLTEAVDEGVDVGLGGVHGE